eukprot:747292-Hanusia_phi.AAC.3
MRVHASALPCSVQCLQPHESLLLVLPLPSASLPPLPPPPSPSPSTLLFLFCSPSPPSQPQPPSSLLALSHLLHLIMLDPLRLLLLRSVTAEEDKSAHKPFPSPAASVPPPGS